MTPPNGQSTEARIAALEARIAQLESALSVTRQGVTLKTYSASIELRDNGNITIAGRDVALKATGKLSNNTSGDMALKGSKILQN